jgi:hypothetical protein
LFENLNTLLAVLVVTAIVVAVNSFLFFGYYLPRTTTPTTSPPAANRAYCGPYDGLRADTSYHNRGGSPPQNDP